MSGTGFDEKEERRRVVVGNERRKLLAGALDRVSTAFIVVSVLGQALSLNPASASFVAAVVMLGWISGAVILHLVAQRVLGGLKV
jgi:hypothetical protein